MEAMTREVVLWGVASRAHVGEVSSGDDFVAGAVPGGFVVGVFDALGHGDEAAVVARIARTVVQENGGGGVTNLIEACHARLAGTRGAAISLARIDTVRSSLTWAGVGNVEASLWRLQPEGDRRVERLLVRSGVVGLHLPALPLEAIVVRPGDTLVMTTDGIREDYDVDVAQPPQGIADGILRDHAKGTDDALALVVRYQGGEMS
jgi:serine phosphatase RsbU (regulator of sigma subunit)